MGALDTVRRQAPPVDHLVRAAGRYQTDTGDRLAAALTYYGFVSLFPLLLLLFAVLGFVLRSNPDEQAKIIKSVQGYFPGPTVQSLLDNVKNHAGAVGAVGLVGLLLGGLGWVSALRESIRVVWHQSGTDMGFIKKKISDTVSLVGLGLALLVSLGVSGVGTSLTGRILSLVGVDKTAAGKVVVGAVAVAATLLVDIALFGYLFSRLPRVRSPWRQVLKGAAFAAVGFEIIKYLGVYYIARTTKSNAAYGPILAGVFGILVWINIVSRFLLFSAAWTVTAPYDSDVRPSGTADPQIAREADRAG